MSTSIDYEAVEILPHGRNQFGPSDLSDSASDSVGTLSEVTDSDSNGTGDRASVESAPTETEVDIPPDISPDKIVRSADGVPVSEGGDDTYEDEELDLEDDDLRGRIPN